MMSLNHFSGGHARTYHYITIHRKMPWLVVSNVLFYLANVAGQVIT